jgi:hypothetical protein
MKGHVDQEMRALLPIRIGKRNATPELEIYAWLDTAFNGELVELETYGCSIHWLGKVYDTQVVTNESEYGLIGTGLLIDRIITVDYRAKTVSVD